MRIFFDIIVILSCIFAPWMLTATLIIIGLISYSDWLEGLVAALLLDMVMSGGIIGLHTLYTALGFCGLYSIASRIKHMLRVV